MELMFLFLPNYSFIYSVFVFLLLFVTFLYFLRQSGNTWFDAMLVLLPLPTKNDATPSLVFIKLTEAILLRSDWLYFLTDMSIK